MRNKPDTGFFAITFLLSICFVIGVVTVPFWFNSKSQDTFCQDHGYDKRIDLDMIVYCKKKVDEKVILIPIKQLSVINK